MADQQRNAADDDEEKDYLEPLQAFEQEIAADGERLRAIAAESQSEVRKVLKELQGKGPDEATSAELSGAVVVALGAVEFLLEELCSTVAPQQAQLANLARLNVETLHGAVNYCLDEMEGGDEDGEEFGGDEDDGTVTDSVLMPGDAAMIIGALEEHLQMLTAGAGQSDPGSQARQMIESRINQIRGLIARVHQITASE